MLGRHILEWHLKQTVSPHQKAMVTLTCLMPQESSVNGDFDSLHPLASSAICPSVVAELSVVCPRPLTRDLPLAMDEAIVDNDFLVLGA